MENLGTTSHALNGHAIVDSARQVFREQLYSRCNDKSSVEDSILQTTLPSPA